MPDADFAEAVLHHLEQLDKACLAFIDADSANLRDGAAIRQMFSDVNARKAELLNHDLLRLDGLAMNVLHSSAGEWSVRFREELTGGQAANVGELHCRVRRRHPSLLNLAKLLRGKDKGGPVGNAQGEGEQASTGSKKRLKQPSDDAIKCYRLFLAFDGKQTAMAEMLARELGKLVDQPKVSRWIKQVREWLESGNVLPDLTANSGAKPKVVPMDPAKIDRGDGRKSATRPRRSSDDD